MKLFVRGNKIWVTLYQDGQRIRKSTGLVDTKENRKKVERELFPLLAKTDFSKKGTVGYYFEKMMKVRKLKDGSRELYYYDYGKYISKYENYPISEITSGLLREWVSSLNVSAATVRVIANVFRQILNEAVYDEAIEVNPFIGRVKLPKLEEYEPKTYSDKEAQLLIANAKGWFRNFLGVLFLTGMRIGEVCALKWDDISEYSIRVDETMSRKRLGKTKTENVRYIPIFSDLKPFIESQRLISKEVLIFPYAQGAGHIRDRWVKHLKLCGMKHNKLYNARHTFAIKALDSGKFKASNISRLLGHSSTQMLFTKYAKWVKSEQMDIDLDFSTLDTKKDTEALQSPKIEAVV